MAGPRSDEAFAGRWRAAYGASPPVGHVLRRAFRERWVRFHSLPDSRRYARTAAERRVLLSRMNALAGELLGEDGACWLVASRYVDRTSPWPAEATQGRLRLRPALRFPDEDFGQDEGLELRSWTCAARWRAGAFDALLTAVADDVSRGIAWVSVDSAAVFAPYDGGADLVFPDPEGALRARARHPDWLSPRPDGL